MIPTVAQVYTAARSVLGDTQTAAGEVFTDDILAPFLSYAYSELFKSLDNVASQRLRRTQYYNVPINTGFLAFSTAGISNMGELESIEERGSVTSWAISGAVAGSGVCTLTNAASTLVTGQQAIVYGVGGLSDDVNSDWIVTVLSTTSTRLNGCAATGTYTSGGVLSYSSEEFNEVVPVTRITFVDQTPQDVIGQYALQTGALRFRPCSGVRQLRITYWLSGDAPTATTASIGIDDSLPFLMYRIAGLAGESKGMADRAIGYNNRAIGPLYDSQGMIGGILGQMLDAQTRDLQRLPSSERRMGPYGGANRQRWGWLI